ncbi:hypothetical protein ACA910_002585 [Epithemia clementina (nom. ined.)]
MSNNYRGGGRNTGGGGRNSGGGGGGRSNYRGGGGGRNSGPRGVGQRSGGRGPQGGGGSGSALYNPCHSYTTSGNCPHGPNCKFAHLVTLHKVFDASSFVQPNNSSHNNNRYNNNNNNSQKAAISSVAIWEMNGAIQIFTGSHDGFWRMWNTANGAFNKQAETSMKGKVECIVVFQNSFLYCGYEAVSKLLPDVPVGMVNAWNLQNTAQPLELHVDPQQLPYTHNQAVTAIAVSSGDSGAAAPLAGGANSNNVVVATGARDGNIRLWALLPEGTFSLVRTLPGHSREITGLVLITGGRLLWSSSTDGSIRIWDLTQTVPEKSCQYCITRDTPGQLPNNSNNNIAGNPQGATGVGHSSAVTSLIAFNSPAGTFILSSSLDGSIKAWDSSTGTCVANESHSEGVVTMALANAAQSPQQPPPNGQSDAIDSSSQVLLIGLESGNIACRNLIQTQNTPAFQLLFVLTQKYTAGHAGAVKAITPGPAATFYTGGHDGNVMVWQFTGDLRL